MRVVLAGSTVLLTAVGAWELALAFGAGPMGAMMAVGASGIIVAETLRGERQRGRHEIWRGER